MATQRPSPALRPSPRRRGRHIGALGLVGAIAFALATAGCAARVYPAEPHFVAGYTVTSAPYVPDNIYSQPRVYYGGNYAYLSGGQWYYPEERGWVVFQQEPPRLRDYRVRHRGYVQQAPPARRGPYHRGYAPPATRVR